MDAPPFFCATRTTVTPVSATISTYSTTNTTHKTLSSPSSATEERGATRLGRYPSVTPAPQITRKRSVARQPLPQTDSTGQQHKEITCRPFVHDAHSEEIIYCKRVRFCEPGPPLVSAVQLASSSTAQSHPGACESRDTAALSTSTTDLCRRSSGPTAMSLLVERIGRLSMELPSQNGTKARVCVNKRRMGPELEAASVPPAKRGPLPAVCHDELENPQQKDDTSPPTSNLTGGSHALHASVQESDTNTDNNSNTDSESDSDTNESDHPVDCDMEARIPPPSGKRLLFVKWLERLCSTWQQGKAGHESLPSVLISGGTRSQTDHAAITTKGYKPMNWTVSGGVQPSITLFNGGSPVLQVKICPNMRYLANHMNSSQRPHWHRAEQDALLRLNETCSLTFLYDSDLFVSSINCCRSFQRIESETLKSFTATLLNGKSGRIEVHLFRRGNGGAELWDLLCNPDMDPSADPGPDPEKG